MGDLGYNSYKGRYNPTYLAGAHPVGILPSEKCQHGRKRGTFHNFMLAKLVNIN